MAEGPRDALVSRNSATTKYPYHTELFDPTFSRFYTIPECDGHTHTERGTDRYTTTTCTALA